MRVFISALLFAVFFSCFADAGDLSGQESFTYNSHNKKDPFSPPIIANTGKIDKTILNGIKLEGIVWDKSRPMAVVNGKIVNPGDKIAGAEIVGITENKVIFRIGGRDIGLKLRVKKIQKKI